MNTSKNGFKALRVCEIPNSATEFPLFIEKDGEIIPYTSGHHVWSTAEKVDLLQNSQFVLFFESKSEAEVRGVLRETVMTDLSTDDFSLTIADGISEFIKARYQFAMPDEQSAVFRGLATALSRYLYQHVRIRSLLEQLAAHDAYTFYHGFRTAAYAVALNTSEKSWDLALGAILHDIGNIYISPAVLNRRGPLAEDEWKKVRKHPEEGHALLQNANLSPVVLDLVIHHHERVDGNGYPHRLKKKDLSQEVRLLAFAEVFAALTQPRPYQQTHTPGAALHVMQTGLAPFLDESYFEPLSRLISLPLMQTVQVG